MNSVINLQPTRIIQRAEATIFYYEVDPSNIGTQSGNSTFCVAYSPTEQWGWELVRYQVFATGNGVFISERRDLQAAEIHYLQSLIEALKRDSDKK